MSMGYGANFAEVVTTESLAKIIGDKGCRKVNAFIKAFNSYRFGDGEYECRDELCDAIMETGCPVNIDTDRKEFKALQAKWNEIAGKFKEATGIGLWCNWHDSGDNGDIYDEVDGLYFDVGLKSIWQPTKAYREAMAKFGEDFITRKFFVSFG